MPPVPPLRLGTSAALKERRLAALLEGRDPADAILVESVREAQVSGSLELSGLPTTADPAAAGHGEPAPTPAQRLHRALRLADPQAPLALPMLLGWHRELEGSGAFRTTERTRTDGPPPAPAEFIESRMQALVEWLGVETGRELRPAQQGALALARILEVLPFDHANGRVARLAASHLMVRAGARPPVLVGGDSARLAEAVRWAFRLETAPLVTLLEEASDRALDVQIRVLEARASTSGPSTPLT